MRLVFAGTPEFAERALAALLDAGHEVALVLTQPDRPAGRGMRPAPSPVKQAALAHRLPLAQPSSLRSPESLSLLTGTRADALVVAAYGLILPPAALAATRLGALNIHASLLPRWRGAAPIQRALLAGDAVTGITIMKMDAGLDTGPVLAQRTVPITAEDDAGTLHDRLAALGAQMMVETLIGLEARSVTASPQPSEGATYARKIEKAETLLDWRRPAFELERCVRAFRPAPGAVTSLDGAPLKVWRVAVRDDRGAPGELLRADGDGLVVACGKGALALIEVQRPGARRLHAGEFLKGRPLAPGIRLGAAGG